VSKCRAVICFNSGSGGDFLKAICNEQLQPGRLTHYIHADGTVDIANNSFKQAVEHIYYNKLGTGAIFDVLNEPVENAHYYIEELKEVTTNLFYIEYPDDANEDIIKSYVNKRLMGDQAIFFDSFKSTLPKSLQNKLTVDNLYTSSKIKWAKNIKSWRANPSLQPVALEDFFNPDKFQRIIKTITSLDTLNEDMFLKTYNLWIKNNNYLKEIFTK